VVEARVHRARVVERAVVPVPARLTHQGATPERVRSLLYTIVHRESSRPRASPADPPGGNTGAGVESAIYDSSQRESSRPRASPADPPGGNTGAGA